MTSWRASCTTCIHLRKGGNEFGDRTCDAFPDGIPLPIIMGRHRHKTPFKGDHGIQYEPKPGTEEQEEQE